MQNESKSDASRQSASPYGQFAWWFEETQKTIEDVFEATRVVMNDLSVVTIIAMRANADAEFSHLEALARARTLAEVSDLQTAYVKRHLDRRGESMMALEETMTHAIETISQPIMDGFQRTLRRLYALG